MCKYKKIPPTQFKELSRGIICLFFLNLRQSRHACKQGKNTGKERSGDYDFPVHRRQYCRCAYGRYSGLGHGFDRTDSRRLKPFRTFCHINHLPLCNDFQISCKHRNKFPLYLRYM